MNQKKIAVIIGSLRKDSFNRKLANNCIELAPKSLKLEILEISGLSMYNQDLDNEPPESWVNFRNQIRSYDGVIFFTPEYNRSIPGVLKNAIDIGSRPYGKSAWAKKPAAVISVSPGATGAFGANHHLRQTLVFLDMPTLQQPEAYIGHADTLFDEQGRITKDSTKQYVGQILESFNQWVAKFSTDTIATDTQATGTEASTKRARETEAQL